MRAPLKCLALTVLFLGILACSTTKAAEKTTSAYAASTKPAVTYPKIVLYTVSWCPHCKEAKAYLSSRHIPYTNLDVEENDSAMETFRNKYHATSVPLIVIGNDEAVLTGFNPDTFEKALNKFKK